MKGMAIMENVYSQTKMFHFYDKLQALKAGDITPPVHVRIKPINACNHRCFYCCYRSESLFLGECMNEKDMIPQAKMREIVRDLTDCGVRAVTFTGGGEPLIYPYIDETLTFLLEKKIKVAVLTNGARLKGETSAILASGASWVRVSIDSTNPVMMAESRNVAESEFGMIIENMAEFAKKKHPDCELGINFIITQKNKDHVLEFIRLMKETGANHVKVCECIVSTRAAENNAYHAPHFRKVEDAIRQAKEQLEDQSFKVIDKFHEVDDKFGKHYRFCPFLSFLNVIAADLNVYTCQDKAYTHDGILGSIKDRSLTELWCSQEYRDRVRAINPETTCRHHCVSHAKNLALIDYLSTDARHLEFV